MLETLIRWSLNKRFIVLLGAVLLVLLGFWRARDMPVDVFPDLTAPTVTVITEAHGMAPEEAEQLVTFPIESALNGASGVRRVRSSTSVGISVIWTEFDWGTDIYNARQIVTEKLQLVGPSLPPDVGPPVLAPISSIMGEILFVGLRSDAVAPPELRSLADWKLRRRLLAVPGVSQVIPIGGGVQQFQVLVRPEALAARHLSLDQVVEAVRKTNENTSAGFYDQGGQEYLIYGLGRVERVEDIAEALIETHEGHPIRVADVAEVVLGTAIKRGDASINASPAVVMGIQKQPGVNTLELTEELGRVLDELEADLPEGVVLERRLLRQADFIESAVTNVTHALRDGALLVIVIVGLFLLSGKATLITATAIPLSLVAAVLVLDALGVTLNTMTLGGMAIAVGAVVDDAIIDVENVARRLRERSPQSPSETLEVVFEASREIRSSIVFATLIIVLVFLPLFFLAGVEGRLLQPLGLAYIISLLASLVVALTVTPALCLWLLPQSGVVQREEETPVIARLRAVYDPLLARALERWPALVALSLAGVLLAGVGAAQAGRAFLPEFNEGALTVSVVTFPGTSLEESNRLGLRVEKVLLAQPEVAATSRRTGRAELDEHAQGIHASEIDVRLEMKERSEAELLAALRADFETIAGASIVIGQPISHRIDHMLSGTRANVAVKLFGPDLFELRRLAEQVKGQMEGVPGVVDLALEEPSQLPLTTFDYDRSALARNGLTVADLSSTIETAFYGQTVSRVLMDNRPYDLVVRYPDDARADLHTLRQTLIPTPQGSWVPLEALAQIQRDRRPNQISRESGERKFVVMCNVGEGRDLNSVVTDIAAAVQAGVELPTGYHIEYGGQFQAAQEASRTLSLLSLLVGAGIFVLLYIALGTLGDTFLVMLNLPLALIGGVLGVYAADGVISVASMIGFVALFGIATRNGIMLVTHIRALARRLDLREAVLRGSSERLAPILMTALASGLGLLPLALAAGEPGSEIQAPMATVILCGLISSTLLNMFVVPAMLLRFGRRG